MKINYTYPSNKKYHARRSDVISVVKWPFIGSASICLIINLCVGGKAWSLIVLFSLISIWSLLFSTDIVEYNRISQAIKIISFSCVLLLLITIIYSLRWAVFVIPMVCFGGIIITGLLFFTDMSRQVQNMLPLLLLCIISLVVSIVGLSIEHTYKTWPLLVMGLVSAILPIACFRAAHVNILLELKKRFHI